MNSKAEEVQVRAYEKDALSPRQPRRAAPVRPGLSCGLLHKQHDTTRHDMTKSLELDSYSCAPPTPDSPLLNSSSLSFSHNRNLVTTPLQYPRPPELQTNTHLSLLTIQT